MKSIKRILITTVLIVLMFSMSMSVFADDLPLDLPEEQLEQEIDDYIADLPSGLPAEQLERKIDEYIEEHKEEIAAVSVAVFTRDGVMMEKSYGYSNIADGISNDADTVFEWASVTKLITWVSVMQLVEQGKLDLNADIGIYLPEGFLKKLKYDDKITMLNLMNHNAGWQESYVGMELPDGSKPRELDEALRIAEPTQIFRPGEAVAYSNFGVALAGYIVERVSGKPFYEYAKENVLAPLGMNQTAIKSDWSDNPWVREQRDKLHGYLLDLTDLGIVDTNDQTYPAGAAFGTIADLRRFGQALLPDENGASPLFQSPDTMAQMYEPTLYYPDGKTAENCHGFWTYIKSRNVIGHGGNSMRCSSGLVIDPVSGIGVAVMTNTVGTDAHIDKISEMIFAAGKYGDVSGKPLSAEALKNLRGCYSPSRGKKTGVGKVETFVDSILEYQFPKGGFEYEELEPGVYKVIFSDGSYDIQFAQFDENGRVQKLSTSTMEWHRVEIGFLYTFQSAALILFVVSILYSILMLITLIIRAIRKKKTPFAMLQLAVCGAVIVAGLTAAHWKLAQYSADMHYVIRGILFLLSALVPVAYVALLSLKWKKLEKTKWQKFWIVVTGIMGLIITLNVFYWQIWMFWIY